MNPAATGPRPRVPAEVLAAFGRPPGRALMLGHVHPDGDVLGTLLALGLALEDAGWAATYGGPHPVPESLAFLPGAERYHRLDQIYFPLDLAVLSDCPDPGWTERLIDGAPRAGPGQPGRRARVPRPTWLVRWRSLRAGGVRGELPVREQDGSGKLTDSLSGVWVRPGEHPRLGGGGHVPNRRAVRRRRPHQH